MATDAAATDIRKLNDDFIACLRQVPTPAAARAARAAVQFTRLRLYSGMIVWGRTYRLYRKMQRNRHSQEKLRLARQELSERMLNRIECCSLSEYAFGTAVVPSSKPLFRT